MLGNLHVIYNYLNAIGQHFENSGADDICIGSGLFATNSLVEEVVMGKFPLLGSGQSMILYIIVHVQKNTSWHLVG